MSSFPENLSYFVFENITPLVNNGEYPLKKEHGDEVMWKRIFSVPDMKNRCQTDLQKTGRFRMEKISHGACQ